MKKLHGFKVHRLAGGLSILPVLCLLCVSCSSPILPMYGLIYRAKQAGVFILYSKRDVPGGPPKITVDATTIEIKIDPLVTTNQDIIDAIAAIPEALELIYEPEVLELDADVDAPGVPREIS